MLVRIINYIGILRGLFFLLLCAIIAAAPWAADGPVYTGWAMLPTVIAPSFVIIVLIIIPLDITMLLVHRAEPEIKDRQRYTILIISQCLLLVALLGAWYPYMVKLLNYA